MQLQCIFMLFDLHLAANCTASCTILHCILHHFALRFAPFYLAFCTKMHCVLRQNALHLAAYCSTFSKKMPQKWCRVQFLGIKIHLACIYNSPLFASKQTFARIDFLRQGGQLVNRKDTHNVKKRTENFTSFEPASCIIYIVCSAKGNNA